MTRAMAEAYDRSAGAWRRGPARLYARLAGALLDRSPIRLAGATVLDAGAGTGVAGDAARARGAARGVAVDRATAILTAPAMLTPPAVVAPPALVADVTRLPFRADAFDLAVAGFVLGHLREPERGMRELRRVSAALLASAFAEGWTHPAKRVVELVLAEHGYRPPPWYTAFKDGSERRLGDPVRLETVARAAGYAQVGVERVEVAIGSLTPAALVAWRFGMAHHAPFLASLTPAVREAARLEAERRLRDAPPVIVPMLVLGAT